MQSHDLQVRLATLHAQLGSLRGLGFRRRNAEQKRRLVKYYLVDICSRISKLKLRALLQ